MPDRIWIWFADNGNIRKWQREPFEEGTEFVSTVTPAEVGGLVDAQTEARAIAQLFDDIYVRDGFCDWADVATARDEALRRHATALEAKEVELAAVKTKANYWQAEYLNACRDAASFSDDLLRAEAALAEARKALEQAEQQLDYGQVDAAHQILIRAARRVREGDQK